MSRALVLAALLAAGCDDAAPLDPPTPPLLQAVSGRGGWWNGGCPPDADFQRPDREALSPQLMERLARDFPPGSDARRLEAALRDQGFQFRTVTCRTAPAVRLAEFRQTGGGFAGPYPIFAQVAWQQDADGRLLWTKATVSFTGP